MFSGTGDQLLYQHRRTPDVRCSSRRHNDGSRPLSPSGLRPCDVAGYDDGTHDIPLRYR